MKTPYSRHDFLLQHYQRWLDDFTRLAVRHGLCHPNIQASHQLTIGSLRFTCTGQVTAVVPHALYRLFCGNPPPGHHGDRGHVHPAGFRYHAAASPSHAGRHIAE